MRIPYIHISRVYRQGGSRLTLGEVVNWQSPDSNPCVILQFLPSQNIFESYKIVIRTPLSSYGVCYAFRSSRLVLWRLDIRTLSNLRLDARWWFEVSCAKIRMVLLMEVAGEYQTPVFLHTSTALTHPEMFSAGSFTRPGYSYRSMCRTGPWCSP